MAINLKSTNDLHSNGVKILVYGQSGAGKTKLSLSAPNPIILSIEGGLLSIKDSDLPYISIQTMEDLYESYQYLTKSDERHKYDCVVIDSLTEVAEIVLATEKKKAKDARQSYGNMQEQMMDLIRSFRDLPEKHIYMSAKLEKTQDEMGRILYSPSMPGAKLGQQLPYFFDEVLALRVEKDADGINQRALMAHSDSTWLAKDRSGKLDAWEEPNLATIINKCLGK